MQSLQPTATVTHARSQTVGVDQRTSFKDCCKGLWELEKLPRVGAAAALRSRGACKCLRCNNCPIEPRQRSAQSPHFLQQQQQQQPRICILLNRSEHRATWDEFSRRHGSTAPRPCVFVRIHVVHTCSITAHGCGTAKKLQRDDVGKRLQTLRGFSSLAVIAGGTCDGV